MVAVLRNNKFVTLMVIYNHLQKLTIRQGLYDTFLFAACTGIAALKNGRNYIGVVDKQEIATVIRKKIDEIAAQEDDDENFRKI